MSKKGEKPGKQQEDVLSEDGAIYKKLASSMGDAFFSVNHNLEFTLWNEAAEKFTGVPSGEAVGKSIYQVFPEFKNSVSEKHYLEALKTKKPQIFETRYTSKDRFLEVCAYPTEHGLSVLIKDITGRKQAEKALEKVNHALKALVECRRLVLHASEEQTLLNDICRLLVEVVGYSLIWIGMAEEDAEKTVRPVAQFGFEDGYLESIKISWADNELGRGPTGTAIRTGKPRYCRHINTDPNFIPWRAQAQCYGYASSVAVPLITDKKTIGAINLYSKIPDAFDADEIQLIEDLGVDLIFGILMIRAQQERQQMEAELKRKSSDLAERVKELSCLFGLSKLIEKPNISLEEIFAGTVRLLPPAFQYPEITCARLTFEAREYTTDNFKESRWMQSADIKSPGGKAGKLEVFYLGEKPGTDEGPFIKEEKDLIDAIAQRLGRVIERKQTQEKNEIILRAALDGFYITDRQGNFLTVNDAYCQMTGYSRAELLGMNVVDLESLESPEEISEHIRKVIQLGFERVETQIRGKDGSMIYVDLSVNYSPSQEGWFSVFVRDISERKRMEEELRNYAGTQAVLLQEINHRVKNNLTALIGMLYAEQERAERKGMTDYLPLLTAMKCRLEGLAVAHDMLSARGWRSLVATDLIQEVVSQTLDSMPGGRAVTLEVKPSQVQVNSSQAHHLTLVINELVTNVLKHTLKEQSSVRIDIEVQQYGDMIRIIFRDNGPGFPKEVIDGDLSRVGIGFEIICGIVENSLQGQLKLTNDNGAVTQITLKKEKDQGNI